MLVDYNPMIYGVGWMEGELQWHTRTGDPSILRSYFIYINRILAGLLILHYAACLMVAGILVLSAMSRRLIDRRNRRQAEPSSAR